MKEANNIKAIIAKHPGAVAEAKRTHDPDMDSLVTAEAETLVKTDLI